MHFKDSNILENSHINIGITANSKTLLLIFVERLHNIYESTFTTIMYLKLKLLIQTICMDLGSPMGRTPLPA